MRQFESLPWKNREDDNMIVVGSGEFLKLPSPWISGAWDGDERAAANAAFIVKAVNSYDIMLSALERIVERSHNDPLGTSKVIDMRNIATEAIELARKS